MARRYRPPHCVVELPSGQVCGHEMHPVGERHPGVRPGVWVFHCGYCDGIQAFETERLDRYVHPV